MTANVFFDVDGTLHSGDIFESYIRRLTQRSYLRTILCLPVLAIAFVSHRISPDRRLSLSVMIWALTFGLSRKSLEAFDDDFITQFRSSNCIHAKPWRELERHHREGAHLFVVSGSPENLVRRIYPTLSSDERVTLIGSELKRFMGGFYLAIRCVCSEKVRQIESHAGQNICFIAGYSDSNKDKPALELCESKYRISSTGEIEDWGDECE